MALAAPLAAPSPAFAAAWKDPSASEKALTEDPSRGLVGAVYLEKKMESRQDVYRVYVRAKIFSRAGFDLATVNDLSEDASEIEGRTISPAGLVTPLSSSEVRTITDVKAAGETIRHRGFTMPALEPGCFVEYSYREEGVFGGPETYHAEILFQEKYPILREELRFPSKSAYAILVRNQKGVVIDMQHDGVQLVFGAHDAPAIHPEPFGLPKNERSAAVIFSFFFEELRAGLSRASTVDEYWTSAIRLVLVPFVEASLARPSRVRDILRQIPGSRAADAGARLRALYRYVQEKLKNENALRAGESPPAGGWKTNKDAPDTLSHGSGRPADLAAVFLSLARADGWRCRPVFVPDREERLFHRDVPSMFQFDTWIVEVRDPGLPRPVDLSFEHPLLSFGQVPWNHLEADAEAIDLEKQTGELVQIPQQPPGDNVRERRWRMRVANDGSLEIQRESRWTGLPAFAVRSDLHRLGLPEYRKELEEELGKRDPPSELDSLAFQNASDPEQELTSTAAYTQKGARALLAGGLVVLSPLSFSREVNPFTQDQRTEYLRFPYPYRNHDTFEITLPEGSAADELPQGIQHANEVGSYQVSVRKGEGGVLVVERTFELKRSSAGVEYYPLYRGLFESAARGDAEFSVSFRRKAGS